MKIKKLAAITAVAGVALTGVIATSLPAHAEVVSNSYVLVGSDTLQDVGNALANGTTVTGSLVKVTAGGNTIGSFDAFPSTGAGSSIQTKEAGPYFGRPNGSGDGVSALSRSIDGGLYKGKAISGQVDIARSSSGPGSLSNNSGPLAYIPFGRDAVSYAYKAAAGVTAPSGIGNLSAAQLTEIYNGTTTQIGGVTVRPKLPQSGSGTRSFFTSAIGVATDPAGVPDAKTTTLAENDASVLAPAAGEIWIIPFSAASWIAQSNGVTGTNTIGSTGAQLGSVDGAAPFTGSGTALVPGALYSNSKFGRDTYVVVEWARIDSGNAKYDAALAALVDSTRAKSLTNSGGSPSSAGAVKRSFGFLAPSNNNPLRANLRS